MRAHVAGRRISLSPGLLVGVVVLLAGCATVGLPPPAAAPVKRVIEFGWDQPDTAYLRRHSQAMEQMPFDGCVFGVTYVAADGRRGPFGNEAWGRRAFQPAEVAQALADLRSIRFHRL